MKVDIDTIGQILQDHKIEPETTKSIISNAVRAIEEEKASKEDAPKPKKFIPLLIVVPHEDVAVEETPAFLLEHIEDMSHIAAMEKLVEVVQHYNKNLKKGKEPFGKIGDIAESFPRKLLKEVGLRFRYKYPLLITKTESSLIALDNQTDE